MRGKWMAWMLSLMVMMGVVLPVSADVIWEPQDNFYESHREECEYVARRYQMAGYEDSVTLYSKPGGSPQNTLENGREGIVQFIWHGEDQAWGYVYYAGENGFEGWAPMDDLSLIYDSQAFEEEHGAQIVSGAPVPVDFTQGILYSYPGGPAGSVLEEVAQYMSFSEVFTQLYTDEDGLRWGKVGYYMGRRSSWICLDDPMNESLDTRVVEPEPSAAQLRQSPSVSGGGADPMLLAGGLVAAVVAVTAVLLRKLHPKK